MRRKRDPGTRNPFSWPLSKQRMIVCWLTLQILAASPVVKTVFMGSSTPYRPRAGPIECGPHKPLSVKGCRTEIIPDLPRSFRSKRRQSSAAPRRRGGLPHPCAPLGPESVTQGSQGDGLTEIATYGDYNPAPEQVNANRR